MQILLGLTFFTCEAMVAAEPQILDVTIYVVDADNYFRRDDVDRDDLRKYALFGMKHYAGPFDKYFPVKSVVYNDCLGDHVELEKNLLKNIPHAIEQQLGKENRPELECWYKFPQFVSQSFIAKVEDGQKKNQPVMRTIYENGQDSLTLCYAIKHVKAKKPIESSVSSRTSEMSKRCGDSFYIGECAVVCSILFVSLLALVNP